MINFSDDNWQFSSLDIGSRIIKKRPNYNDVLNNKYVRIASGSFVRGKNYNTIICNKLLNRDYKSMSKLDVVNFAEINFLHYLDVQGFDKKGNVVCDSDDNNYLMGLKNKYSVGYRNKIKRRMSWLCHQYKNSNAVFLTLTIDPKKYLHMVDMWRDIKYQQNNFFRKLRYHLKKQGKVLPPYIATIECQHGQDSWMHPHIHILFFNCRRLMDWRKIRDIWNLGHVWINRTGRNKKIRKPVDYITKYITKTYTETTKDNLSDQAIQWLFNIRSFSTSRGLIWPLSYVRSENEMMKLFYVSTYSEKIFNWFQRNIDRLVDYYYDIEKKSIWPNRKNEKIFNLK